MLELRTWLFAGIVSYSTIMCSGTERAFSGKKGGPEDSAGQGGEAFESVAGEGGAGNAAGAAGEAGESAEGGASAGEAGARGSELAGSGGVSAGGGFAGMTAASGGSAGAVISSGGSSGVTGAGGGSGGSAGCPSASARCVPLAPSGWQGPLLVTANAVNNCPDEFPTKSPVLYSGLLSGSASCACNCGAPQVTCAGSSSLTFYQEAGCSMSVYGVAVTEGSCQQQSSSVSISYSGQATAICNAAVVEPSLPVPIWSQSMNACSGARVQGTCSASSEVCVAKPSAPFAAKYCIAHSGEQSCPAAYSARSVLYAGYQDTRACPNSCSCTASGQDCALQVDVHTQADCSGSSTRKTVLSGGSTCAISSPTTQHAFYASRVVTKPGSCSATGTLTPTGAVVESGPTTLCCTE